MFFGGSPSNKASYGQNRVSPDLFYRRRAVSCRVRRFLTRRRGFLGKHPSKTPRFFAVYKHTALAGLNREQQAFVQISHYETDISQIGVSFEIRCGWTLGWHALVRGVKDERSLPTLSETVLKDCNSVRIMIE